MEEVTDGVQAIVEGVEGEMDIIEADKDEAPI
jgi:hypothetical protein